MCLLQPPPPLFGLKFWGKLGGNTWLLLLFNFDKELIPCAFVASHYIAFASDYCKICHKA